MMNLLDHPNNVYIAKRERYGHLPLMNQVGLLIAKIIHHGEMIMKWISVDKEIPPHDEYKYVDEGVEKKGWGPRLVLLKRLLKSRGAICRVVQVGEYDDTGIPPEWRVWHDFVCDRGYEGCESWVVDDVTHWMEIPDFPDSERDTVGI